MTCRRCEAAALLLGPNCVTVNCKEVLPEYASSFTTADRRAAEACRDGIMPWFWTSKLRGFLEYLIKSFVFLKGQAFVVVAMTWAETCYVG